MDWAMIIDRLRYVHEDADRNGNVRVYFWRGKGHRKIRIRETPGTPAFRAAYDAALAEDTTKPAAEQSISAAPKKGTWRWLCVEYLSSGEFIQLGHHTRRRRRQLLEQTWSEPIAPKAVERFAEFPLNRMTAKAIRVLRDRKANVPESANGLVKAIRQVFTWAIKAEIEGVTSNPARDVPYFPSKGPGWHTWTVEEVRQYEARHPVGTKARLALDLLLYTGVRRSDVVRLGRQMVRRGWLHFTEMKGRERLPKERAIPILSVLAKSIAATPSNNMAFLTTEYGQPFTGNGFGNKMREWCDEAGLPHCSAHGLRKAGATIAAENGASDRQLMAIFGWETEKQANVYTKKADRKRLAGDSMHLLIATEGEQNFPTEDGDFEPAGKKEGKG
jgi:integrase